MKLYFNRTKPFRNLQRNIGSSTYRLNTIFVGLNCIADGGGDGGAIAVSWAKPSEKNKENVANQARIFACASALLLGADTVDSYLRNIVILDWAGFSKETIEIVTKQKTKSGGISYSLSERVSALYSSLNLKDDFQSSALGFLGVWRNVVAHSEIERQTNLNEDIKEKLLSKKKFIHDNYSHLNIELAIKNFEARNPPVGKEVTSLLAMATNFCREIDQAIISRLAGSEEKMIDLTDKLLVSYFNNDLRKGPSPWAEISEAWQGSGKRRKNNLEKILQKIGISRCNASSKSMAEGKNPARRENVSHELSEKYINEILSMDRYALAKRFNILIK